MIIIIDENSMPRANIVWAQWICNDAVQMCIYFVNIMKFNKSIDKFIDVRICKKKQDISVRM